MLTEQGGLAAWRLTPSPPGTAGTPTSPFVSTPGREAAKPWGRSASLREQPRLVGCDCLPRRQRGAEDPIHPDLPGETGLEPESVSRRRFFGFFAASSQARRPVGNAPCPRRRVVASRWPCAARRAMSLRCRVARIGPVHPHAACHARNGKAAFLNWHTIDPIGLAVRSASG